MSDPADWQDFRTAIRLTREIFAQEAFKPYVKAEIQPGPAVQSDDDLDAFIREHAESAYHPCGTARMGRRDDPMAVVDPETPGDRRRGLARGRQLDLPADHQRQHQRPLDHDRREGRRPHPRPYPAAAVGSQTMVSPRLADPAALARAGAKSV